MSFTYDPNTMLGVVRFLVSDTVAATEIFSDEELNMCLYQESSQALYVSGQAAATAFPAANPAIPQVYSVWRAAAMALSSLAANSARLAGVTQLLDVKLDIGRASSDLRTQAADYREREENAGHFAIAEMVFNPFTARERVFKQWQRQYSN